MADTTTSRGRKRPNGVASRDRILVAATAIAAERGYEGTSIALVSATCGLPASSIYWHFRDKDDLLAAVIEHSFTGWMTAWELPEHGQPLRRAEAVAAQIAAALMTSPDFLRLGLMLTLERRPVEPRARAMFLNARTEAYYALTQGITQLAPGLSDDQIHLLATFAIAGADGLFIAKEIGGERVDLAALFQMHARAMYHTATQMLEENAA
ncbi:TetR/AcrR family transcriptional regulator [Mycobacterium colombiense]|uniref:TetR family transcriptional regulator n=1 Tax=Mycobacterium colombiense TaxID=339268 RepID=A0A1A2YS15_9MYCO|nr:TetR/AcrR family transcriptional regulator [Mycobacterium colombiense]OBI39711.1 TetR family transcriptional regulator [Mycobacterium colombiense]